MNRHYDNPYQDDMFTTLGNFGLWCAKLFFKMMAFCLLGAMLLSGLMSGWRTMTGDKSPQAKQAMVQKAATTAAAAGAHKTKATP